MAPELKVTIWTLVILLDGSDPEIRCFTSLHKATAAKHEIALSWWDNWHSYEEGSVLEGDPYEALLEIGTFVDVLQIDSHELCLS